MEYVRPLVDRSRREDGTVRYYATTDVGDPNTLRFFEQYEDEAALEAHTESEAYREFVHALPNLVDGQLETVQFEAEERNAATFDAEAAIPDE